MIASDVRYIKQQMKHYEVEGVHTIREGKTLAYFFSNYAVHFAGTNIQQFHSIQEIPQKVKAIV